MNYRKPVENGTGRAGAQEPRETRGRETEEQRKKGAQTLRQQKENKKNIKN
jgi:hypothetical protein